MKTRLSVLACILALAVAGCRENDASIEIFALCAPPDDAVACGMSGECEMYLASARPFVFVTVGGQPNRLEMFMQMNNQLPNNEDVELGRANTNDFIGEEYVLNFRGANGVAEQRFPANFTIPASSSFSPVVVLIPEAAMMQIDASMPLGVTERAVIVELEVRGRLVDGSEIETGPFNVAVDVVNADFTGFACPKPTEVVTAVCPNTGQTASVECEEP